jgi:hypothetical protein
VIAVEGQEGLDVVGLALALRADLLGVLQRGEALGQVLRGRRAEGVVEEAERLPPVGHHASGVALQDALECIDRGVVPERVLQLHRPIESGLSVSIAGDREMHLAQDLMVMILLGEG